jgi:hypothetical protein
MKRPGPDLKMPDLRSLKVPPVLNDLYQDLRDRRLLPLVGLILFAIVAMPFLLGGGSPEEEVAPPAAPLEGSASSARQASLSVVPAQPGLRDYRKRLRHRNAANPFKPQYTGPVLAGTQLGGSSESTSSTTTTTESSSGSSEPSTGAVAPPSSGAGGSVPAVPPGKSGSDNPGGGNPGSDQGISLYTFAIDVKITKTTTAADGKKSKPEEIEKQRVLPPASLPGEKTPVVTYIGISPKTSQPLFLVSEEVESTFGDVKCLAGTGRCQLLELEPGLPVTFVTGEGRVRYKFNVLAVEPVIAKQTSKQDLKP